MRAAVSALGFAFDGVAFSVIRFALESTTFSAIGFTFDGALVSSGVVYRRGRGIFFVVARVKFRLKTPRRGVLPRLSRCFRVLIMELSIWGAAHVRRICRISTFHAYGFFGTDFLCASGCGIFLRRFRNL